MKCDHACERTPKRVHDSNCIKMRTAVLLAFAVGLLADAVLACPSSCKCSGTSVDCSGQGLDAVPEDLPSDVTDL